MLSDFLKLSPKIWVLPVIHGSGDLAIEVRRVMLGQTFDCLAVPLPPSFQRDVEEAITWLPQLSLVVQEEPLSFGGELDTYGDDEGEFDSSRDDDEEDDVDGTRQLVVMFRSTPASRSSQLYELRCRSEFHERSSISKPRILSAWRRITPIRIR